MHIKIDIYIFFYYYYWVDSSAGGLLVSERIIRPVLNASALTWLIKFFFSKFKVPKLCNYY